MSLLFMDSFDHYATADIAEKWTQLIAGNGTPTATVIGAYGRNSSNAPRFSSTNSSGAGCRSEPLGVTLAPANNVCIMGCAVKYSSLATLSVGTKPTISFWGDGTSDTSNWLASISETNTYQLWFRVNTNGTISAMRGNATASTVLGTTSLSLQAGVWAYVEIKATIDPSVGTVDIRINGVSGLSLTGQNTRTSANSTWTNCGFGFFATTTAATVTADFDDLLVMDGSGSYNNAFIGDVTISILNPTGAGNSTDWTASAGSNYQCVDEAVVNDDTDYVSSSTLNAKDLYAMEDCAAGADIRAVQVVTAMRKGTEGPGKVKHVIRSNSTDYDSAEISLGGTAYSFNRTIWETDPATAAPWSESGWNAAEVGVKKTG
jgi:hypothetical protein